MPDELRPLWGVAKGNRGRGGAWASRGVRRLAHSPAQRWTHEGTEGGHSEVGQARDRCLARVTAVSVGSLGRHRTMLSTVLVGLQ